MVVTEPNRTTLELTILRETHLYDPCRSWTGIESGGQIKL